MVTGGWIRIMLETSSDQGETVCDSQTGAGGPEVTLLDGEKPFFLKPADDFFLFGHKIEMIPFSKILERNSRPGPETEEERFELELLKR